MEMQEVIFVNLDFQLPFPSSVWIFNGSLYILNTLSLAAFC